MDASASWRKDFLRALILLSDDQYSVISRARREKKTWQGLSVFLMFGCFSNCTPTKQDSVNDPPQGQGVVSYADVTRIYPEVVMVQTRLSRSRLWSESVQDVWGVFVDPCIIVTGSSTVTTSKQGWHLYGAQHSAITIPKNRGDNEPRSDIYASDSGIKQWQPDRFSRSLADLWLSALAGNAPSPRLLPALILPRASATPLGSSL